MDTNFVGDLARKLARSVPGQSGDLKLLRGDLERTFQGVLSGAFERMDIVTREEFDVQRKVLERTREKLSSLETQIRALEARPAADAADDRSS